MVRTKNFIKAGAWALAFFIGPGAFAQAFIPPDPKLPVEDRIRLAEAFRIARLHQNKIWEGWHKAPFAVLLVASTGEFLLGHPKPSDDFEPYYYDDILKTQILSRRARFPANLLATFPAIGGLPTIVVGQPGNVSKSSAEWVISVLHEHFHQLQMSAPGYFPAVESLGLAGEDKTGRWMIDYPFPYDSARIGPAFAELGRLLVGALRALDAEKTLKVLEYLEARKRFQELLTPEEYKYFSFQLWQEGVARYTELKLADRVARTYKPTSRFRSLLDFTSFRVVADSIRADLVSGLLDLALSKQRRIAFYYLGAGEALLLDRVNPNWQKRYFKEKFFIEKYF
ncbi:MAG: hypothetical protein L0Z48_04610 [candidate division Zixibacteria bacterium]|nr:hypothetical protein [candidate division Zixibacteria bacterium]MCI0595807.1 hypothetical protein [candidate division Zixibacteria bacterium]